MTAVLWVGAREAYWDQHLVSLSLNGQHMRHQDVEPDRVPAVLAASLVGCVLVVPGRFHGADEVNHWLRQTRQWCVLIITSDEESTLQPAHLELDPDRHRLFVMTPRPHHALAGARPIVEGFPPGTSELLAVRASSTWKPPHVDDVAFLGQVTHERRQALHDALVAYGERVGHEHVHLLATAGFTQGISRRQYLETMAATKIAPCPSGPATPDSFRLYEALEAGCMPIVEATCPGYEGDGYWPTVFPNGVPFPIVHDWTTELDKTVEAELERWPANATRAQAWWTQEKARLRRDLRDALWAVGGGRWLVHGGADDAITVVVTVSPTSDPIRQMRVLNDTIMSARERLPHAEIVVACDGVRPEQEDLRARYESMLHHVTYLACHRWEAVVEISDRWLHQAGLTALAMRHVHTETILFMEQDTPLEGTIPFAALAAAVTGGEFDLVRLHHESEILPVHRHLMLDSAPNHLEVRTPGRDWVPLVRTIQWSQRPHVASAGRYRTWLAAYFGSEARTMIEDVMHGVVQNAWTLHGPAGWQQFRLGMFAPEGNMRRCYHADTRQSDPKYPMRFRYDGATPEGAPSPDAGA